MDLATYEIIGKIIFLAFQILEKKKSYLWYQVLMTTTGTNTFNIRGFPFNC